MLSTKNTLRHVKNNNEAGNSRQIHKINLGDTGEQLTDQYLCYSILRKTFTIQKASGHSQCLPRFLSNSQMLYMKSFDQ